MRHCKEEREEELMENMERRWQQSRNGTERWGRRQEEREYVTACHSTMWWVRLPSLAVCCMADNDRLSRYRAESSNNTPAGSGEPLSHSHTRSRSHTPSAEAMGWFTGLRGLYLFINRAAKSSVWKSEVVCTSAFLKKNLSLSEPIWVLDDESEDEWRLGYKYFNVLRLQMENWNMPSDSVDWDHF